MRTTKFSRTAERANTRPEVGDDLGKALGSGLGALGVVEVEERLEAGGAVDPKAPGSAEAAPAGSAGGSGQSSTRSTAAEARAGLALGEQGAVLLGFSHEHVGVGLELV